MANLDGNGGSRKWLDPRISVGNVLTIVGMIVTAAVVYASKESELATLKVQIEHIERQQDAQDSVNAQQDARWQIVLSDLKGDIRDLRTQIEQLLQRK